MPPRKKPKNDVAKNKEQYQNLFTSRYEPNYLAWNIRKTNYLATLPLEVLLLICKFLSPVDLSSLSQIGDLIFKEMVQHQREYNLSTCWRAGASIFPHLFTIGSGKNIQKLNFNCYKYARPCDIVEVICKCKSLKSLSILECGVQYTQILEILKNCSSLKELSWTVIEPVKLQPDLKSSVTKLCLLFELNTKSLDIYNIFQNFPNLESAVACCSPDTLSVPPFNTSFSNSLFLASEDKSRWIVIHSEIIKRDNRKDVIPILVTPLIVAVKDLFQMPLATTNSGSVKNEAFYINRPPFLKIKACDLTSDLFSSISSVYSSIIIDITLTPFDTCKSLFQHLSQVTGPQITDLTMECEAYDLRREPPLIEPFHEKMSDLFGSLLLDCKNITTLSFGSIHFGPDSPFKAMCNLKNLKYLNMPTCAFPKELCFIDSFLHGMQLEGSCFHELVTNCTKVEEFHLYCCYVDFNYFMQPCEVEPIQNWKKLRSFTIYSVSFHSCNFLRDIADCCPEFQFFSYITTAKKRCFKIYEDIIYLLENAKKLSFIS